MNMDDNGVAQLYASRRPCRADARSAAKLAQNGVGSVVEVRRSRVLGTS